MPGVGGSREKQMGWERQPNEECSFLFSFRRSPVRCLVHRCILWPLPWYLSLTLQNLLLSDKIHAEVNILCVSRGRVKCKCETSVHWKKAHGEKQNSIKSKAKHFLRKSFFNDTFKMVNISSKQYQLCFTGVRANSFFVQYQMLFEEVAISCV